MNGCNRTASLAILDRTEIVKRNSKADVGSVAAACVVLAAVTITVLLHSSNGKPMSSGTTTLPAVSTTIKPTRLSGIAVPTGSIDIFNIKSASVLQPTGQLPANEAATLYYTCVGSAALKFTFNGKTPLLTTPCRNQVQFVEVAEAPVLRTIAPQSQTTDTWHVIAVKGDSSI
jgi:hypothetical protein